MTRQLVATATALVLIAAACSSSEGGVDLVDVAPDEGECIVAPGEADTAFTVVPCDEQHGGEVVARVDMADYESPPERPEELQIDTSSDDMPEQLALMLAATDACSVPFEEYVGIDYISSRLSLRPILPTSSRWAAGDREVVCVVVKLIAPTVGDGDVPEGVGAVPGVMTDSVRGTAQ